MAKTPARRSSRAATDGELERILEEVGEAIGKEVKKATADANRVADEAKTMAAGAASAVEDLRKEVDELAARPPVTPSAAQALLRGFKNGLK